MDFGVPSAVSSMVDTWAQHAEQGTCSSAGHSIPGEHRVTGV